MRQSQRPAVFVLVWVLTGLAFPSTVVGQQGIDAGIGMLAADIAEQITAANSGPVRIAVLRVDNRTSDETNDGLAAGLGSLLSEELSTYPNLLLVEQERIAAIVEAAEIQQSGLFDVTTAVRIGQLVSAELLILPELVSINGRKRLSCRIVAIETSEILGAVGVDLTAAEEREVLERVRGPAYRLEIGAFYQRLWPLQGHAYGGLAGFNYVAADRHRLRGYAQFGYSPYFDHVYADYDDRVGGGPGSDYEVSFYGEELLFGLGVSYGYRLQLSRFLAVYPEMGVGYMWLAYNTLFDYYEDPGPYSVFDRDDHIFRSLFAEVSGSFTVISGQPIGVFLRPAFRYFVKELKNSASFRQADESYNSRPWAFHLEAGITVYF